MSDATFSKAAKVIADFNACGYCEGECGDCSGQAQALLDADLLATEKHDERVSCEALVMASNEVMKAIDYVRHPDPTVENYARDIVLAVANSLRSAGSIYLQKEELEND